MSKSIYDNTSNIIDRSDHNMELLLGLLLPNINAPIIEVSNEKIDIRITHGATAERIITIRNIGRGVLSGKIEMARPVAGIELSAGSFSINSKNKDEVTFTILINQNRNMRAATYRNEIIVSSNASKNRLIIPLRLNINEPLKQRVYKFLDYNSTGRNSLISSIDYSSNKLTSQGLIMVTVGEVGTLYTIPTGIDNTGTAQVAGGYEIAKTQVTYEMWHEVCLWAEANRYKFLYRGLEGSVTGGGEWPNYNNIGKPPTRANNEPVTTISWRDCIVWLNALSEKQGLAPVYRTRCGNIIRDADGGLFKAIFRVLNKYKATVADKAVQTKNNGYRLPTSMEWEMAARWKNDVSSSDGSIKRGSRWWTPGNYASGASESVFNSKATEAVAWIQKNSGGVTNPVGRKKPNALGVYDMSGNVAECCFDWHPDCPSSLRVQRGVCYLSDKAEEMMLGSVFGTYPDSAYNGQGFRIARSP